MCIVTVDHWSGIPPASTAQIGILIGLNYANLKLLTLVYCPVLINECIENFHRHTQAFQPAYPSCDTAWICSFKRAFHQQESIMSG